jgi:hypothetical protein
MHKWLQDFAYRINISWWIFLGAGLLAVIIALATSVSRHQGGYREPREKPSH